MKRWWRRDEPGIVRVDHRRLIELLRGALRACELERDADRLERDIACLEAELQARDLLAEAPPLPDEVRAALLAGLPLTAAGGLHEEAFRVLVDARVWEQREQLLGSSQSAIAPHEEESR